MPFIASSSPPVTLSPMTKLLQDAIDRIKELSENRRDQPARALIDVAEHDEREYQLADEQAEEIRRRRATPNRKFTSLAEARTRLRHVGA
jgi:hypothetical protein